MSNKKYIFELSSEQHEALSKYAKANNKSKTDIIRLFCDSLCGIDPKNNVIIIHDDKVANVSIIKNKNIKKVSDVSKLDIRITYEKNMPFYSKYEISKQDTVEFGGDGRC